MPIDAYIGLGGNLGDRAANLDRAVVALAATPGITVVAVSAYRDTIPVGGPLGQPAYLNAAVALTTTLEPRALLRRLHAIEAEAGRVRAARWGERTLDLDLLLYGRQVIDDSAVLQVPHPRLAHRRFVLEPLAEVAPHAFHPLLDLETSQLLAMLDRRPSLLAVAGAWRRPDLIPGLRELATGLEARLIHARDEDSWVEPLEGEAPLEQKARRWSLLAPSNLDTALSWLISDFVPEPIPSLEFSIPPDWHAWRAGRVEGLDGSRIWPTLVVATEHDQSERPPLAAGVPILTFDEASPNGWVRDILTACQATR